MDLSAVEEIMDYLPKERTLFHYHQDRYALMLLGWAAGDGCRVDRLKRSPFAPLLEKPVVKQALAACGGGEVDRASLEAAWGAQCNTFLLTLGSWGSGDRSWDQTSRKGHNLVLRLNFNQSHDRAFRQLVKPGMLHPFRYYGHPVMHQGEREYWRETLAWARMDIDLDRGEALIEEIQSDWVRLVNAVAQAINKGRGHRLGKERIGGEPEQVRAYAEEVFTPYRKLWDQAMLAAAIRFIRDELGLKRIWYHSWEGGNRLKKLDYSQPPRSLYTQLPRRFCFRKTEEAPGFLARTRPYQKLVRKTGPVQWHQLEI
jgi:hypothetical protein